MKILTILILLIIFTSVTILTDGKREKELRITSLDIRFENTNATFIINYNFDKLSKIYFLMLGTQTIEPKIRSLFSNFEYEIVKIDPEKTVLNVKNISRLNKGYYLHNSQKFGGSIDRVYISDPSTTRTREYFNINATPDYFYRS